MKKVICNHCFFLFLCVLFGSIDMYAQLPAAFSCQVKPVYRYRNDGKPGREMTLMLKGQSWQGQVVAEVSAKGKRETSAFTVTPADSTQLTLILPEGIGVKNKEKVTIVLNNGKTKLKQTVEVPVMRHWVVYLYNHAHVDIGYTNTHKNVELLHKSNIVEGIKLAEETAGYPRGAQFVWNPEVTWPLERLWVSDPDKREDVLEAIRKGQLCIDANYLNLNTSTCSDEELFHTFLFSRKMQKLTGKPMTTLQQMDIPGMSWGLIPVMAQEGVRYIMSWPNSDRAGNAHQDNIDGYPFWWVGPDGTSRVLFFQPGGYANSGSMGKGGETGRPWFGQRDPSKVPAVIKTGYANVDFTGKLADLEGKKYPYHFCVLSWSLWDNNPLDADVPHAVKDWNEKYAYPKIIISGAHEIMSMIESRYGDKLPVVKGDYTEYWTDGLGTAAALTAMNRNSKERLLQAETVWSMLADGKPAPRADFDEAWRYIGLGSEHTWCSENPSEPFFQDAIWKVKQSYFHEADDRSQSLLAEAVAPVTDKSNGALGPQEGPSKGGIAVLNTHSWKRGGVLFLSKSESRIGNKVVDEKGQEVPAQRLSDGRLMFLASDVPALSSRHYRVVAGESLPEKKCVIDGTTLSNGLITVVVDPKTGNVTSLTKNNDAYNYIDTKVDGGANSFSWLPANVDAPVADTVLNVCVTENGPLAVELTIESKARGCRSVSRSVRLVYGQPWVEISNVVDKLPLLEKDGIHFGFGFNIPASQTRVDIPWGVMEVEKDQWKQGNRNWLAMQRWLDVSNATRGVTWCSLDAPLFQYGTRSANISLSWGGQGPWLKELKPSSTIYSWVMNNHWHTNFPLTQDGPVIFRYRLMPHDGFDVTKANRFGLEQSQPLVHVTADKDPAVRPAVLTDNDRVYVTILKSTGVANETIVRLRSLSTKEESVTLSFPGRTPKRTSLCSLEETPDKEIGQTLTLKPYGQVTLKLEY